MTVAYTAFSTNINRHKLECLVGNFVYFTVLGYTEHSHTTLGNVTLPLTVDNAEFSCKSFRTY